MFKRVFVLKQTKETRKSISSVKNTQIGRKQNATRDQNISER
jgi:hypothetical protein